MSSVVPTAEVINALGKVAVLMGGWSAERDVSLQSGAAVLAALLRSGVDAHGVDFQREGLAALASGVFDRVFIMLHGRGGEDGQLQGALEIMQLPYTGSGILGSALGMDKQRCKQLWRGLDLSTPRWMALNSQSDCQLALEHLGLPLMVKPSLEGSSIGISKVNSLDELHEGYVAAAQFGAVMAEQFIEGNEYTVAILNGEALPVIRLQTPHSFYDYEAKYHSHSTSYYCPSGLSREEEQDMQFLALSAFESIDACGWGRVDIMCDEDGGSWLIEVNTVPGMTSHSLVPMAAKAAGLDFDELVFAILCCK
ncbi:MAG: D-alanine--D-alanine ligase [Gammaproteobacteria bacterium]|nr:D-alanine--D-alanine ligase [Gammaproteobacteria bacterium]